MCQNYSPERTVGVLWVNAAETYIDVKTGGNGIVDSIVNLVGGTFEQHIIFDVNALIRIISGA